MAGNLYDKARGQRGLLEKIGGFIPGFGGYQDRERRRDADRLEREFVANTLFGQKTAIKRAVDDLMSNGNYDNLAIYEKVMGKIDKVAQKINNASQGYAGMFDTMKVGDAELEKLYQYDLGLVEAAKEVELAGTELPGLASDATKCAAKAKQMGDLVDRIDEYFSKRAEWLTRG